MRLRDLPCVALWAISPLIRAADRAASAWSSNWHDEQDPGWLADRETRP